MKPKAGVESGVAAAGWVYACVVGATLVSLLGDGFEFGVHNNVFHVPYVLEWNRLPAFTGDAFVQSLRFFTSAVWLLLRAVCNEGNVESVFLVAQVVTRLATFVALAALVRQAGVGSRVGLALAMAALATTPWLHGDSVVAGHGLLINYFTHSEVAWPFVLFALRHALEARWRRCAAHAALAFLANAFVGLWLMAILAAWLGVQRRSVRLASLAVPALLYLLIAAPVLAWVALAIGSPGATVDFSFAEFLRLYFPRHFFLDSSSAGRLGLLAACLLAGWSSSHLLPQGAFWRLVLGVSVLLFLTGAVTPYFIDARLLFNLHLMRVDGIIQLSSMLLVVCAAVRVVLDPASLAWQRGALLCALAMLLIPWRFGMPAIAVLCLAVALSRAGGPDRPAALASAAVARWREAAGMRSQFGPLLWLMPLAAGMVALNWGLRPSPASAIGVLVAGSAIAGVWLARKGLLSVPRVSPAAALALTLASLASLAGSRIEQHHMSALHALPEEVDARDEADWIQLAAWIRQHPISSEVLVPIESPYRPGDAYMTHHNFQLTARTTVWVDWKQGAAVMWYPQFFHRWAPRYLAARDLRTPGQFLQLARSEGIPYFVPPPYDGPACPDGAGTVHASGRFKLCATSVGMRSGG